MAPRRLAFGVLLLLVALMLASGVWRWGRTVRPAPEHPEVSPTETATAAVTAGVSPAPLQPPPGFRLAGVAVGTLESFAVVEAPHGAHALYRVGNDVPGLGRIVRINAECVIVQGASGQFELWLAPASTPTSPRTTPRRLVTTRPSPRAATTTPGRPVLTPTAPPPPPARGSTTAGSPPSTALDRPAS